MRKATLIGGLSAMAVAAVIAVTSTASAQQYYGDGWYGRGMMGGHGFGPGMMYGPDGSYRDYGPGDYRGYGYRPPRGWYGHHHRYYGQYGHHCCGW